MNERTRNSGLTITWLLALAALFLAASAGAADPVADGLSEERSGVVQRIDAQGRLIVVDGQTYQLVENHNEALSRMLAGSNAEAMNESADIGAIEAGDEIRYAVDVMSARFAEGDPILFVLRVE